MQELKFPIDNILANLGIKSLNNMQEAAINAVAASDDVILLSATGSGKTLAFLIPLLQLIDTTDKNTQALIIVPSRELAQQIELVFKSMGTGLKITSCYGGHLRETEENNLKQPPAIIVGTPGRLGDHIRRGNITTGSVKVLVLDEFDKSLEMGFEEEVSFVTDSLRNIEKKILTSATEAEAMPAFIGLKNPVTLNFLPEDAPPPEKLAVKTVLSDENDKLETLFKLLCYLGNRPSIIFCNHRDSVERTSSFIAQKGIPNTFYHGGMEQQQRDSALCKFRNGTVSFLVTTDLAARGLDIPDIRYIIHYHLPLNEESYIHRNGRTARMEATGTAIIILSPEETLPPYIESGVEQITLPEKQVLPEGPKWTTLFIAAGKKDKVSKIDIVGFLSHKGELKKDDIGLVIIKDHFSFAAIRKSKANNVLHLIKNEKIKNKKVLIAVAK